MNFIELLFCNDEFTFRYNNIKYSIISEKGKRSIYEEDTNKLIGEYSSNEILLNMAIIDGRKITDIIDKIEII